MCLAAGHEGKLTRGFHGFVLSEVLNDLRTIGCFGFGSESPPSFSGLSLSYKLDLRVGSGGRLWEKNGSNGPQRRLKPLRFGLLEERDGWGSAFYMYFYSGGLSHSPRIL